MDSKLIFVFLQVKLILSFRFFPQRVPLAKDGEEALLNSRGNEKNLLTLNRTKRSFRVTRFLFFYRNASGASLTKII